MSPKDAVRDAEFRVVDDAGDPDLNRLLISMPPTQIVNVVMRIPDWVNARDDDHRDSRLYSVIRRRGQEYAFEMTVAELTSNGRLGTATGGSPLTRSDLMVASPAAPGDERSAEPISSSAEGAHHDAATHRGDRR